MTVTLERLKENGAYAYEAIFLTQLKSYSFGQMSSNDFILYAPTVENNHCIFHNQPNGLFVEVLKNSSGMLIINGKTYLSSSVVRLNNNDIVNIGLLLKYKVKMKIAIPIADNSDYLKNETDEEDCLLYQNVNDSNVENLENEEATLSDETPQSEISQIVMENSSEEIESVLSLQEIDAAMQIEIEKEENKFENSVSIDSSAETQSFPSSAAKTQFFDSSEAESNHLPSESTSHEFATEATSDSLLRKYLTNSSSEKESLSDYLPEKEPLSDSLPEKVPLPDSATDDKLLSNSSSKEKNLSSTQHSLLSLNNKVLCLKLKKLSSAFLEKKTNQQRLQTHSVNHSAERPFGCYHCGKRFKIREDIRQHIVQVHSEDKQTCKLCKKIFKCKNSLKQHMLIHPKEIKFKCFHCEKGFRYKCYLQIHMLSHSTERIFKCSLCDKDFTRKDCLKNHMLCHSTERNFKCFLCEKDFGRKYCLQQHMLIHSTEKNFMCSQCGDCFKSSCSLVNHVRKQHTKERLFKCKFCQKEFLTPKRCEDHQQIHTGEKP